jgi:GTP diphosphokinase / guanosine-3',5'-bis(diphosphate) 3'-diphosphatase
MGMLEKAIRLAAESHQGQVDKAGDPYILHPLRIMMLMCTEEEKMVAVLHDVLEDTATTPEILAREGFPPIVIDSVKAITRGCQEGYFEYIERVKKNPIARIVKMRDLIDNMNMGRIQNPTLRDMRRIEKYQKAFTILGDYDGGL